jgi:hypothetical protein
MPSAAVAPVPERPSASPFAPFHADFAANRTASSVPTLPLLRGFLPPQVRLALAAVLARFQLGEAGEGRVARQIDRIHSAGVDADYRAALKLFVAEEGRHARVLAALVRGLGGTLLTHKASNLLFRRARRLAGLRFKVVVLLTAELVGAAVYRALAARAGRGGLGDALATIATDEDRHLAFHATFLRLQGRTWRLPLRAGLYAVTAAALAVVLLENARDLARCDISARTLVAVVRGNLRIAVEAAFPGDQPS